MPKYKVAITKKDCEFILQSKAMVASHPHKVEVVGSSPTSVSIADDVFFFAIKVDTEVRNSLW